MKTFIISSLLLLSLNSYASQSIPNLREEHYPLLIVPAEEVVDTSAMEEQYKKEQPTKVTKEEDGSITIGF